MSGDNTATRQRRRTAGRCIDCGMPRARTQRCSVCNERNRERERRARAAVPSVAAQRKARLAWVRSFAAKNPTLEWDMLAEATGMSRSALHELLGAAPERRRLDYSDSQRAMTPDKLMLFPFFGRRRRRG